MHVPEARHVAGGYAASRERRVQNPARVNHGLSCSPTLNFGRNVKIRAHVLYPLVYSHTFESCRIPHSCAPKTILHFVFCKSPLQTPNTSPKPTCIPPDKHKTSPKISLYSLKPSIMDHLILSAAAPFMTMATSDYYPYPMYTAQDSTPLRRRQDSLMTSPSDVPQYNGPTTNKRFRLEKIMSMVPPPKPAPLPKPVQRVDSGFDAASETSSVTFTDEVERLQAAKLYLHRYHDHDLGAADEDEEEDFVDEGNLGLMHRDSICLVAERAVIWEDKAVRAKRNSKSKLELAKKWLERKLVPGSDRCDRCLLKL